MRKSEPRYGLSNTLLDLLSDGVVVHELASGAAARFVYANPAICEMLGYTAGEMETLTPADIQDEDGRNNLPFEVETLLTEKSLRFEKMLLRKDGWKFPAEINTNVFYNQNRPMALSSIRDMTERKETETKLQESEAMLARAQQLAHIGHWDWDIPSAKVIRSDELCCISGLQPGDRETDISSFARPVYDEDRESVDKAVRDALAGAKPYDEIHRLVRPDGGIRWVHSKGEVARSTDGAPLRMFGTVLDITEHRLADTKYARILETALDGFWIADMEGKFLEVNDAYCCMSGYAREKLLSMSLSDVEAVETPAGVLRHIGFIKENRADHFTSHHRRKDGSIIDLEVRATYLHAGNGQVVGFAQDITERNRIEKALRSSEEAAMAIMNASWDSIFLIDATGIILAANTAGARRYGTEPSEMVGRRLYDYSPEDLTGARRAHSEQAIRTKEPVRFEDERAGRRFDIVVYPVCDESGEVAKLVIDASDVTERKQAEEALRKAHEELEQKVRERTERADGGVPFASAIGVEI